MTVVRASRKPDPTPERTKENHQSSSKYEELRIKIKNQRRRQQRKYVEGIFSTTELAKMSPRQETWTNCAETGRRGLKYVTSAADFIQ